jgi:hypothetical protein
MPVKFIHRRYICFKIPKEFDVKKLIDTYIYLFGIVSFFRSGFRIVSDLLSSKDLLVIGVGSKYVSFLVASATYLSLKEEIPIILVGVFPTLKKLATSIQKN